MTLRPATRAAVLEVVRRLRDPTTPEDEVRLALESATRAFGESARGKSRDEVAQALEEIARDEYEKPR